MTLCTSLKEAEEGVDIEANRRVKRKHADPFLLLLRLHPGHFHPSSAFLVLPPSPTHLTWFELF